MCTKPNSWNWLRTAFVSIVFLACADKNDPAPQPDNGNLVEATSIGSWSAAQLSFLVQLSGQDIDPNVVAHDVDIYKVTYTTSYLEDEIDASGIILLPKASAGVPMISFQHGTLLAQSDAPSLQQKESEQVLSYAALASMGFITAVPDMIGFGESGELFHPYYIEEPTADAVTDLLLAAKTLAAQKQIDFDGRLFLAGYSQGGYATLAAHKAIESDPMEGLSLEASFAGAGGYDLVEMLKYFRGLDTYDDPYYLAYVGMSYQSYYNQNSLLSEFFNEPYASRIPSLFDGIKSGGQIDTQLSHDISTLVNSDILETPENSPVYSFLAEAFVENSLTDWKPHAPLFMYHGDADTTVPLINSHVTYEKLLSNGADPDNLNLIILPGRDHTTAVQPFIEDVVRRLQAIK